MKEVIAVIRMNKIQRTKEALAEAGYPGLTATLAYGCGKQRGLSSRAHSPSFRDNSPEAAMHPLTEPDLKISLIRLFRNTSSMESGCTASDISSASGVD